MRVKESIYRKIKKLSYLEYDHNGAGGLPMRADVRKFALIDLFSPFPDTGDPLGVSNQVLELAGEPNIKLNQDGTVELFFSNPQRELVTTIQCAGVVTYVQLLDDGDTSIDGTIRIACKEAADYYAFNAILTWLARG